MQYEIRAKFKTTIDGSEVEAGDVLATVASPHGPDLLESLLRQMHATIVRAAPSSSPAIAPAPAPAPAPVVVAPAPAPAPVVAAPAPVDATVDGDDDSEPLAGLPPRIAAALQKAGFDSAEAVRRWVAAGNDLIDLDGIGGVAKNTINDWLETVA